MNKKEKPYFPVGSMTVDVGETSAVAYFPAAPRSVEFSFWIADASEGVLFLREQQAHFFVALRQFQPSMVFIEGVQIYGDSLKSLTSATRGNLSMLAYLVGVYVACCNEVSIANEIVLPRQYKGQLDKEAINKRLIRIDKMVYPNQHVRDAVAMGYLLMGRL
jgi:hypothetical protein